MKKQLLYKPLFALLVLGLMLILARQALATPSAQNTNLVNEGYITLDTAVLPGLSVSGINIVANGQAVRLRGINMGDPFWARGWYGATYSTADYVTLSQDWHANVVRISIFPTQWKNMDQAALLAGLAQEVNAALNNEMYVIISYHVIGWPNGWYQPAYPGNPADTYDSSLGVATSFWTQMAQTYGSDTRIIFDLWNEPVHDSSDWVGADPNPYWPELKLAYESLIQTVRNNGAQNIVLATGNRWASWLVGIKDNPLADSNVVYAYHKYSSPEGPNTPAEWNQDTGGLIGLKPVIVSEWGYEDSDAGANRTWPGSQASYGDPFTQWMENNNLSNLAWMYHHDWTPALLNPDGSSTLYGTFVKQYTSTLPSVHFAVIGDYGFAGQAELDVANRVKSWNPDFIVTVGDNNYLSGSADTIDANIGQYYHDFIFPYTGSYGAGSATNRFFPVPGNHDWIATNAHPYLDYFSLPGNERYYDFVQGPVHFFMLDSDIHEPHGNTSTSAQAAWLNNSLSSSSSPWNIVLLHHAPFSSGKHGSDTTLQWPYEAWGADAVLAGHDHTYERILKGATPYFVNGLGGSFIYNFRRPIAGSQRRYNANYGAMLVDATNAYINFRFITRTGVVIDSFALGTIPIASVNSIMRANANPASAINVNFTVTFSESVTGVDAGDFSLTTSGVAGAAVSGVSGSGRIYTVTVNTGAGNGTIRLNVVDNDSIVDILSNPLGGTGAGNGSFTSGETYTITKNLNTYIGGSLVGSYFLLPSSSQRDTYAVDSGPVKVVNTDGMPIIAALRDAWLVNGQVTSFSQLMGLPKEQLSDTYLFPAYNNITLSEQIRLANVDTVATTVTVTIGGVVRGTYNLQPNESKRVTYNLDSGPVEVKSSGGTKIIAAIRDAWLVHGQVTSFTQIMGLPKESLSDTYLFPAYNNVTLSGQLRIGNVDTVATTVTVKIAGAVMGTYPLNPSESTRVTYPLDAGPVEVSSSGGVKIIAALRDAWLVNGQVTSFSQLMGLPKEALSDTYLFPAYNNINLSGQLRIGNADTSATTVTVKIGGVVQGTYPLNPGESLRVAYPLDSGPVEIKSSGNVKIIAALRDAWLVNGAVTSFTQMMGLPNTQLSDTYWIPAYNNITLSGQLRFGMP